MKKTALALLVCLSFAVGGFAMDVNLNFNTDTGILTISGETDSPLTITAVTAKENPELISFSNPPYILAQFDYRYTTKIFEEIKIDPGMPSKKLHVSALSAGKTFEKDIVYINADDLPMIKSKIDNALKVSTKALSEVITENSDLLGIDEDIFTGDYENSILNRIYEHKQKLPLTGMSEFFSLYSEGEIVFEINGVDNSSDLYNLLSENKAYLGIELDAYYPSESKAAQDKLTMLFKQKFNNTLSFEENFNQLCALAAISAADRWQSLKKAVSETYKDIIGINLTGLASADKVFAQMMQYSYNSFSDINKNFNAANEYINNVTPPATGPASSGPSGTGGKGVPSIGAPSDDISEENKKALNFSDLTSSNWAFERIAFLAERGIIKGYEDNTFKPLNNITRAEFVKMTVEAFSLSGYGDMKFSDISENDWYYGYIRSAYSNGIINGVSENEFSPEGHITREDAAVILYRCLKNMGIAFSDNTKSFTDSDSISAYALECVETLYGNDLINGMGENRFMPLEYINRESCSGLLYSCILYREARQ